MDFKSTLSKFLGNKIRERRVKIGLNQEELSEKISLTRTSISNIEAGRQLPPIDVLYNICNTLGTEIHFFLPTFKEVNSLISEENTTLDKLKTKHLSEGSIKTVQDILSKKKR
ncbi:helix-turn-helix domain-containing protein [Pedobacter helvus]|uniref:Helix-turn-helix domain-containing protein n=1 Tax=Pedobacter helvus TaxID=2563444 RepID=A0ABW9JME2_9SPHI|nr:helix-turn-helix transcriptional regulator [Pedobacter ureilyticus]